MPICVVNGNDQYGWPVSGLRDARELPDQISSWRTPPGRMIVVRIAGLFGRQGAPPLLARVLVKGDGRRALAAHDADESVAIHERMAAKTPHGHLDAIVLRKVLGPDERSLAGIQAEELPHGSQRVDLALMHRRRAARTGGVGHLVSTVVRMAPEQFTAHRVEALDSFLALDGACAASDWAWSRLNSSENPPGRPCFRQRPDQHSRRQRGRATGPSVPLEATSQRCPSPPTRHPGAAPSTAANHPPPQRRKQQRTQPRKHWFHEFSPSLKAMVRLLDPVAIGSTKGTGSWLCQADHYIRAGREQASPARLLSFIGRQSRQLPPDQV